MNLECALEYCGSPVQDIWTKLHLKPGGASAVFLAAFSGLLLHSSAELHPGVGCCMPIAAGPEMQRLMCVKIASLRKFVMITIAALQIWKAFHAAGSCCPCWQGGDSGKAVE